MSTKDLKRPIPRWSDFYLEHPRTPVLLGISGLCTNPRVVMQTINRYTEEGFVLLKNDDISKISITNNTQATQEEHESCLTSFSAIMKKLPNQGLWLFHPEVPWGDPLGGLSGFRNNNVAILWLCQSLGTNLPPQGVGGSILSIPQEPIVHFEIENALPQKARNIIDHAFYDFIGHSAHDSIEIQKAMSS